MASRADARLAAPGTAMMCRSPCGQDAHPPDAERMPLCVKGRDEVWVVGWWQAREWLARRAGCWGVIRPRWPQSRSPTALPGPGPAPDDVPVHGQFDSRTTQPVPSLARCHPRRGTRGETAWRSGRGHSAARRPEPGPVTASRPAGYPYVVALALFNCYTAAFERARQIILSPTE